MPGLSRVIFQRSTSALFIPSANTVFTALTPDQSTVYTVNLSRAFKPTRQTSIYFPSGLPSGVACSTVHISGSASAGWTAAYVLFNGTSNTITPLAQPVIIYQED